MLTCTIISNEGFSSNQYQIIQEYDNVPLQLGDGAEEWGINSEKQIGAVLRPACYVKGFTADTIDLFTLGGLFSHDRPHDIL